MNNNDAVWFEDVLKNNLLVERLKKIKLIVSDIDGCLTDGKIAYSATDEFSREFSIQDGFAIAECMKNKLMNIALLSGKNHDSALLRAQKLGIPNYLCLIGRTDKIVAIKELQKKLGISMTETIMFGDDHYDAVIRQAYPTIFFTTPCDAPFYYQDAAELVVPRVGGDHAFRLLLDLVLYVQEKHFAQDMIDDVLL